MSDEKDKDDLQNIDLLNDEEAYQQFLRAIRTYPNAAEIIERADLPGTGTPNEKFTKFGELVNRATEMVRDDDKSYIDDISIQYIGSTGRLFMKILSFTLYKEDYEEMFNFISQFDIISFEEDEGAIDVELCMQNIIDEE